MSDRAHCGDWQSAEVSAAATAQRILFRTNMFILFDREHAKDVPLLGERRIIFELGSTDPQSSPKLPKNQFLAKSDLLTEKCENFAMHSPAWIHEFLPSLAEIGKAVVTKRYSPRIRLVFCPFVWGF